MGALSYTLKQLWRGCKSPHFAFPADQNKQLTLLLMPSLLHLPHRFLRKLHPFAPIYIALSVSWLPQTLFCSQLPWNHSRFYPRVTEEEQNLAPSFNNGDDIQLHNKCLAVRID